jgi:hypothetical protein
LPDQTWLTFLHDHASEIWACDFLQTYDLLFRLLGQRHLYRVVGEYVSYFNNARPHQAILEPASAYPGSEMRFAGSSGRSIGE